MCTTEASQPSGSEEQTARDAPCPCPACVVSGPTSTKHRKGIIGWACTYVLIKLTLKANPPRRQGAALTFPTGRSDAMYRSAYSLWPFVPGKTLMLRSRCSAQVLKGSVCSVWPPESPSHHKTHCGGTVLNCQVIFLKLWFSVKLVFHDIEKADLHPSSKSPQLKHNFSGIFVPKKIIFRNDKRWYNL